MGKPIVQIPIEVWRTIRGYVLASDIECSMLAEVETKNNRFIISKIYLPKQTRSAAFTKITHEGVMEVLSMKDADPSKIKAWFHSHVNMGVSPSPTDKAQAEELMVDADWFIRGIFNKKGEYSMHVHWMGIEVEAEMQISYDGYYDLQKIKQELESVTVHEITVVGQKADSQYGGFYPNQKRDRGSRAGKYAYKVSDVIHKQQNKYLSEDALLLYGELEEAPTFAAFMWKGFKDWANTSKKTDLMYFADLYEEFLLGLDYGFDIKYCYTMVSKKLTDDQEAAEKEEKLAKEKEQQKEQIEIAGVTQT